MKGNEKDRDRDESSTERIVTAPNNQASAAAVPSHLKSTASKANLNSGGPQNNSKAPVSKVHMRNLAMQSKQDLIIKKRLLREKNEGATCGGYELIYPFISYEEEEKIREKVA